MCEVYEFSLLARPRNECRRWRTLACVVESHSGSVSRGMEIFAGKPWYDQELDPLAIIHHHVSHIVVVSAFSNINPTSLPWLALDHQPESGCSFVGLRHELHRRRSNGRATSCDALVDGVKVFGILEQEVEAGLHSLERPCFQQAFFVFGKCPDISDCIFLSVHLSQ